MLTVDCLRRLVMIAMVLTAVSTIALARSARADDSPYLNVWVHYDYMVGSGYSDAPSAAAIQLVVDAFRRHGVTLHIDPQHAAIPARQVIVPDWPSEYSRTPGFDDPSCTGPDAVRFSDLEQQYFQPHSNHPWHYAVFGNDLFTDSLADAANCPIVVENGSHPPVPGMAGYSQVGFLDVPGGLGYDLVVNMQQFRDIGYTPTDVNVAAIFMHELGHNLGLCHGGPNLIGTDCTVGNSKPNYISVMNNDFEFGIPYATAPGSTTIAGYRVDYSDVKLPDLDETNLDENVGIQDSVHPTDISENKNRATRVPVLGAVDWNGNGNTTDTGLQRDVNGDQNLNVLHGADDWAWLHSRLTPPAITNLSAEGKQLFVSGTNLMAPATVIFSGGARAVGESLNEYDMSPGTAFGVSVPVGAKSGPITVVTPEGTVESSQSVTITATAHGPQGIAAGPDGNVWFTEREGNAIGRITPAGAITEFPVPTPSSWPWRIAAGPDGNLWFTERKADKIARITPSGKITEFPVPSSPSAITAGPDGNLWFTKDSAQKIGRITPTGTITEFSIP
jgi:hypothetical protein